MVCFINTVAMNDGKIPGKILSIQIPQFCFWWLGIVSSSDCDCDNDCMPCDDVKYIIPIL